MYPKYTCTSTPTSTLQIHVPCIYMNNEHADVHMYLIYTYKMTYKIIYMYMYPTSHLHLYLHVHLHVNYITSTSCIKFTNVYKWMCILHVLVCMDFEVYICLYLTSTTICASTHMPLQYSLHVHLHLHVPYIYLNITSTCTSKCRSTCTCASKCTPTWTSKCTSTCTSPYAFTA